MNNKFQNYNLRSTALKNNIFFYFRFGSIPDMLELDHITVSGDVTFGKGVSVKVNIER